MPSEAFLENLLKISEVKLNHELYDKFFHLIAAQLRKWRVVNDLEVKLISV